MQWSQLRKRVQGMFADCVKGRIQLRATRYREAHDQAGRYWITLDGKEIVNMPHQFEWFAESWRVYRNQGDCSKEFADFASLWEKGDLYHAMVRYLTMGIDDILCSENVLVQAIGMLDRRLGKRRLRSLELENAHPLVRLFHQLRCEAESVPCVDSRALVQNMDLRHPAWPCDLTTQEKKEKRRQADALLGEARIKRIRRSLGPSPSK